MKGSRQYTVEEQQKMVLDHLRGMIHYWEHDARTPSLHGKLEGLVFSVLVMIDGGSMNVPCLDLVARTHPTDPPYHRERGENWWPSHEHLDKVDGYEPLNGAVALHEMFHEKERKERAEGTYREPPPTDEDVDIDETARAVWKCLNDTTPIADAHSLLVAFAARVRATEAEKWRERQTTALHSHMLATFSPDVAATEAAQQIARLTKERDFARTRLGRVLEAAKAMVGAAADMETLVAAELNPAHAVRRHPVKDTFSGRLDALEDVIDQTGKV